MLIDCSECGKKISHKAISCPNCGWMPPLEYQYQDEEYIKHKIRQDADPYYEGLNEWFEKKRSARRKKEEEEKKRREKEQEKKILEIEEGYQKIVESFKNLIKWLQSTEDFFLKLLLFAAISAFISWIS